MTHRILAPIKTLALSLGLRLAAGKTKKLAPSAPEPITQYLNANAVDEWMFDRDGTPVTPAAEAYSRELGRTASALSSLRGLLSEISAHAPVYDAMPKDAIFSPIVSDDMLFDGEPMAAKYGNMPLEDADLFMDAIPGDRASEAEIYRVA